MKREELEQLLSNILGEGLFLSARQQILTEFDRLEGKAQQLEQENEKLTQEKEMVEGYSALMQEENERLKRDNETLRHNLGQLFDDVRGYRLKAEALERICEPLIEYLKRPETHPLHPKRIAWLRQQAETLKTPKFQTPFENELGRSLDRICDYLDSLQKEGQALRKVEGQAQQEKPETGVRKEDCQHHNKTLFKDAWRCNDCGEYFLCRCEKPTALSRKDTAEEFPTTGDVASDQYDDTERPKLFSERYAEERLREIIGKLAFPPFPLKPGYRDAIANILKWHKEFQLKEKNEAE